MRANTSMAPQLDVLFEDEQCLLVNKPAGISTQSPAGIESLESLVREYIQTRQPDHAGGQVYLGLPHRLDRPVSGVIVLAKTRRAARKISRQFERRRVRKVYWAAVEGSVSPAAGAWSDSLRKVPDEPRVVVCEPDHPDGRQAVLRYRTIGSTPLGSLLEIELETGRMHQIRVQAASRGHPVLGDAQYGSVRLFGRQTGDPRQRAIALHAREIEFTYPGGHERRTFTAQLSDAWKELKIEP